MVKTFSKGLVGKGPRDNWISAQNLALEKEMSAGKVSSLGGDAVGEAVDAVVWAWQTYSNNQLRDLAWW